MIIYVRKPCFNYNIIKITAIIRIIYDHICQKILFNYNIIKITNDNLMYQMFSYSGNTTRVTYKFFKKPIKANSWEQELC